MNRLHVLLAALACLPALAEVDRREIDLELGARGLRLCRIEGDAAFEATESPLDGNVHLLAHEADVALRGIHLLQRLCDDGRGECAEREPRCGDDSHGFRTNGSMCARTSSRSTK